jgi:hypothetical protein
MSTPNILRRYMDILAERVTLEGHGFQPAPPDPNAPPNPRHQAMRQARDSAESAANAWFATRPTRADGRPMPGGLNPTAVEKVLAGADPATVIFGRANTGAFGSDPSQYQALAQAYITWLAKQPAKFDPMDPKWD